LRKSFWKGNCMNRRLSTPWLLITLLLLGLGLPAKMLRAVESVPSFYVVLERDTLLPDDAIPVEVWLTNPTGYSLGQTRLSLGAPNFIQLRANGCAGSFAGHEAQLGPIAADSIYHCRARLLTESRIVEGSLTLTFALRYRQPKVSGESLLVQEKKVKINLFGNQNIAGIDMSLIVYLLPGLLVLFLLRQVDFPSIERLSPTETATAAVIFSTAMLLVRSFLGFEEGRISRFGFAVLCLGSLVLAGIIALPWIRRKIGEQQHLKLLIRDDDSVSDALRKAFLQSTRPKLVPWFQTLPEKPIGPVKIELAHAAPLWGSLIGESETGFWLFGWFEIDPGADGPLRQKMKKLLTKKNIPRLLDQAKDKGLELKNHCTVRQETPEAPEPWPLPSKDGYVQKLRREDVKNFAVVNKAGCPFARFPVALAGTASKNYRPQRLVGDFSSALAASHATARESTPSVDHAEEEVKPPIVS
jgi:hypothetical protein